MTVAETDRTALRVARARPHNSVAWTLGRLDARRALRHPLVAGASVAAVVIYALLLRSRRPVMHADDILAGLALLVLAAAALLVANDATVRERRDSADAVFDACPTPRWVRDVGHLGAAVSPALAGVVVAALLMLYALFSGGVGTPDALELLGACATIVAAGTLGVVLGRWFRTPAAASVALALLGALHLYSSAGATDTFGPPSRLRWLLPWVALSPTGDPAPELVARTPGWHLVYLLAATVVGAALVAARRPIGRGVASTFGIALVVLAFAAAQQTRPLRRDQQTTLARQVLAPDRSLECEVRHSIDFCFLPTYSPWVEEWSAAVDGVVARIPEGAAEGVTVVQVPVAYGSDVPASLQERLVNRWQPAGRDRMGDTYGPHSIFTSTNLPSGGAADGYRAALAAAIASHAVDLPTTPAGLAPAVSNARSIASLAPPAQRNEVERLAASGDFEGCSPAGQARAIVAIWLAASADPENETFLKSWLSEDPAARDSFSRTGTATLDPSYAPGTQMTGAVVAWPRAETRAALVLAARPDKDVGAVVLQNWDVLIDPRTPSSEGARILGLEPDAAGPERVEYERSSLIPCP